MTSSTMTIMNGTVMKIRRIEMYAKQNHPKYRNFSTLNENDQQAYWGWRHEHSDALLKINIQLVWRSFGNPGAPHPGALMRFVKEGYSP